MPTRRLKVRKLGLFLAICYLCCLIVGAAGSTWGLTPEENLQSQDYSLLLKQDLYTVGIYDTDSPICYLDETGQPSGVAVDVMNEITDITGIDVEYVVIEENVNQNSIDINLATMGNHQLEYHNQVSIDYLNFPLLAIGSFQEERFEGLNVGVPTYYGLNIMELADLFPGANLIDTQDLTHSTEMLASGQLDYVVSTSLMAKRVECSVGRDELTCKPLNASLGIHMSFADWISPQCVAMFDQVLCQVVATENFESIVANAAMEMGAERGAVSVLEGHFFEFGMMVIGVVLITVFGVLLATMKKRKEWHVARSRDYLTGVLSVEKFIQEAKRKIAFGGKEYAFIALDIDNFTQINDVYGYEKGGQALAAFAQKLADYFDQQDLICRIAGDQFMVLTARPMEMDTIKRQLVTIGDSVVLTSQKGEDTYKMYTSAGICKVEDSKLAVEYMMSCAQEAQMSQKHILGNTCVLFSDTLNRDFKLRRKVTATMEEGLKNREFAMVYQPKFGTKTLELVGCEALVRWVRGNYDLIYPNYFIPIFEKNRFIIELDYYVFDWVCRFIKRNQHIPMPRISLNLSSVTFLEEDLTEKLEEILSLHGVSASQLDIEITESAVVEDCNKIAHRLRQLRAMGFTISMDDFGTGVSSLSRFKDIQVDSLKIDKGFLWNLQELDRAKVILSSIVTMAKNLGVKTVVEGIETREQLELVAELGCDEGQGYYYSRPISEGDFIDLVLREQNRRNEQGNTDGTRTQTSGAV